MSQSQTQKAKQNQPEQTYTDNIRNQTVAGQPISAQPPASPGAAGVAVTMGFTVGQAALFLQTGQQPLSPV